MTTQQRVARTGSKHPGTRSPFDRRWSLGQRLAVLVGLLLVVVVAAFGYIAYDGVRSTSMQRTLSRIESVARELETSMRGNGEARLNQLSRVAEAPAVRRSAQLQPTTDSASIAALLDSALKLPPQANGTPRADTTLESRVVIGADGTVAFASGTMTSEDTAILRRALDDVVSGDSAVRSPLFIVGNEVHVWSVVPVYSAPDEPRERARITQSAPEEVARSTPRPVGALAELRRIVSSNSLENTVQRFTGEAIHILITSRGGADWSTVQGKPFAPSFALPEYDSSAVRVQDSTGAVHYVAQARVGSSPYVAVVTASEANIMERPNAFLRRLVIAGSLLLLFGVAAVWWVTLRETRPLVALKNATSDVAHGDYSRRVPVSGSAELAALSHAFNLMAARVGQVTSQLEHQNVALAEANEAKARFLAVMSHELRTPLNAIGGFIDLMSYGVYGPVTPEQEASLARVRRSKDQLLHIVTDILHYSKLDAGRLTLRRERVDVREQFGLVAETLGEQAAGQGVNLRIEPTDLVVMADPARVLQVLLNLATNAIRFTESGGTVTLSAHRRLRDRVELRVADTGVGIPSEHLEMIFEPFRQVDSSLTRKVGGTGLGLTIVRDLTRAMGGTVEASSQMGRGSVFTVVLESAPQVTAPAPTHREVATAS